MTVKSCNAPSLCCFIQMVIITAMTLCPVSVCKLNSQTDTSACQRGVRRRISFWMEARPAGPVLPGPDPTWRVRKPTDHHLFPPVVSLFVRRYGPDISAISRPRDASGATGAMQQFGAAKPAANWPGQILISPPGLDIFHLEKRCLRKKRVTDSPPTQFCGIPFWFSSSQASSKVGDTGLKPVRKGQVSPTPHNKNNNN